MTVRLVHGIRTSDPMKTMGGLNQALFNRNLKTSVVDYGYILVPITNGKARDTLIEECEPGDTLVGYSNGAYAVWQTAEEVQAKHIVLISPALRRDVVWPECVESITVFYSPDDSVLNLGYTWASLVNIMPWRWGSARDHDWGRMGLLGPETEDPRVKSFSLGDNVAHWWYKYPDKVDFIADRIFSRVIL